MPLLDGFDFPALAEALGVLRVDGWLLYDFRKVNPIAERILGPTGMGTRRLFVLLPLAVLAFVHGELAAVLVVAVLVCLSALVLWIRAVKSSSA